MNEAILDLNEFLERIQNDRGLLWELLDIFVEDFQEKKDQLAEAIVRKDSNQIRRLAHALKGSCANISAHQLSLVLLELEIKGKNEDLSGTTALLEDVNKKFEVFLTHLSRLKRA